MMASGLQTAKRDLRKKIRDVLQKTPNESIVLQCQTLLLSPTHHSELTELSQSCYG